MAKQNQTWNIETDSICSRKVEYTDNGEYNRKDTGITATGLL